MKLSKFLVLTAGYNFVLGTALLSDFLRDFLEVELVYPGNQMITGFLWFTTAALLISSRDIKHYASIIYYEAYLRFFAATVLLVAVYRYDFGIVLGIAAVGDIIIGVYYIVALKIETPFGHQQLLTNRLV